jgi:hypothetical protein
MILFLLALVVIGFVLFLFNRFAPMDANIKSLINYLVIFVLIIVVIFFVLDLFGLYSAPAAIKFWK